MSEASPTNGQRQLQRMNRRVETMRLAVRARRKSRVGGSAVLSKRLGSAGKERTSAAEAAVQGSRFWHG
jgi:hypothetical protein